MENKYMIITDSTTDLMNEFVIENNIEVIPMTFTIDGIEYKNYLDGREISNDKFYSLMKEGKISKTAQLRIPELETVYEKYLKEGYDLLIISFSSALSGSYNASRIAIENLKEKYSEKKIYLVDSLLASLGEGLLVYYANEFKKRGYSIDKALDEVNKIKNNVCSWFMVDDIDTLKRGGRVSSSQAFIASALNIKPVLHVNNKGELEPIYKKVGRKKGLLQLIDTLKETIIDQDQIVIIGHATVKEDAEFIKERISDIPCIKDILIHEIGPVIGSHTGPGMIGVFFLGKKR